MTTDLLPDSSVHLCTVNNPMAKALAIRSSRLQHSLRFRTVTDAPRCPKNHRCLSDSWIDLRPTSLVRLEVVHAHALLHSWILRGYV